MLFSFKKNANQCDFFQTLDKDLALRCPQCLGAQCPLFLHLIVKAKISERQHPLNFCVVSGGENSRSTSSRRVADATRCELADLLFSECNMPDDEV